MDVAAGKYRSDGQTSICIAQVRADADSEFAVGRDKLLSGDGQQTVVLKRGQYMETQGCGTWTKVG